MELPVRFPNDADVIAEKAARFRAFRPTSGWVIRDLLNAGEQLIRLSPKAEFLRQ